MKKIVIIGNISSGKTTLAKKLGEKLNIPVHHLDKVFWAQKGGIKQDDFIEQQKVMMLGDSWVMDGNFMRSDSFDMRLINSDTIIYFDLSKFVIYWRLLKRFVKYFNKVRPDLGGNNKFHIDKKILRYIWDYPKDEQLKKVLEYSNTKNVIILRNVMEEKSFLKSIGV